MSKPKRPPIPAIVAMLLLAVGAGYWWWSGQQAPDPGLRGTIDSQVYQVAPLTPGRVTKVHVKVGDVVEKGAKLVSLDRALADLNVKQAEQGVSAAEAGVRKAKSDGEQADIDVANAKLEQAKIAVEMAKTQASYTTIAAPHAGVVTSISTTAGQNAAPAKTLLTLVDPGDVYAIAYIPEPQLGSVTVGQKASVASDSVAATTGKVTFIATEPQFTPASVETKDQRTKLVYEIRISLPAGDFKAGMPVDVELK